MSENKKASATEPVDFEQSMKELDALVSALENGEMSLENALTAFEKGVNLLALEDFENNE